MAGAAFRFLLESSVCLEPSGCEGETRRGRDTAQAELKSIPVPAGVTQLDELVAWGGAAGSLAGLIVEVLEAPPGNGQARLLLLNLNDFDFSDSGCSDSGGKLNGGPMPRVAVLAVGDQLTLAGGHTLHVSRFAESPLRAAGQDDAGRICPLCRSPIEAERRVYHCSCGTLLHADDPRKAGSDALECYLLASQGCSDCGAEVAMEEGLVFVPAGLEVAP